MNRLLPFLLLILVFSELTAANIYYVPDDFPTIQTAINSAQDNDTILIKDGTWDAFDFYAKNLTIKAAEGSFPIISSKEDIIVDMSKSSGSVLQGFTINGTSDNLGILILNSDNVNILDCTIQNTETGIQIDNCSGLTIRNSSFKENLTGIMISGNWSSLSALSLENSVFSHNEAGLLLNDRCFLDLSGCRITDNGIGLFQHYPAEIHTFWDRCTLSKNDTGIIWSSSSFNKVSNSIVWNNTTNITGTPASLEIEYSNIEGGYNGTGNIDADPYFCFEYPYEYFIMEGSPCIDAGDPTQTDPDGTRYDMGWYIAIYDVKECAGEHWNWVSFPRLDREGDEPVDVVPLLENFLDWDFHLQMLYKVIFWVNPTLEYTVMGNDWTPEDYDVISSKGYKLNPDDAGDHYLPTVYHATRLPADWELEYTLYENDDSWMGYWLPYTQNIEDAFGEFFDDLVSVSAEDWYYEYSKYDTPSSSTANKNMVYGKGYVVVFERDINDFYWTDAASRSYGSPGNSKPEPQYFSFGDLPNYEAIDVMEIPAGVIEIGVFEDDVCVGAVVVQDEAEQILAYTGNVNRSQVPLTFEVVTGSRQTPLQVSSYKVLNRETGQYEPRSLIAGQQQSSVVLLGNPEDPQINPPSLDRVVLHGNYPNPFNPETSISFQLNTEITENTELTIYNMKGQKVKQLVKGQLSSGAHSFSWNGTDDESKPVSSGLYLYKLKVGDRVFSKKMLMLK